MEPESSDSAHVRIARQSVRGSVILLVGNFLQIAVAAVTTIVIARILGPDPYGLYTLSFVVPSLLQLFLGIGVNSAVTRYAAYYVSIGRPDDAKRFTRNGIAFLIMFGLLLTVVNFGASALLSTYILHRPEMTQYVQVASVLIVGQAILQSSYSALIGWNSMRLAAVSSALQSVLRLGMTVGLVLAGFGVVGAIAGNVLSYLLAGAVLLLAPSLAKLRGPWGTLSYFASDVNEMIRYGFPVFAGSLIGGLAGSYLLLILASIASNTGVGLYQAAANVSVPVTLVSNPILTALFPAVASLDAAGGDVAAALRHAVKYYSYLVTPVIVVLIPTAGVFIGLLYGHAYSTAAIYLRLDSLSNLPYGFGLAVIPVFFNGVGKTRLTMAVSFTMAVSILVFAPLLGVTLGLGIPGLIYALLLANGGSAVVGLVLAGRIANARVEVRPLAGILAASLVALAVTYPVNFLPIPEIASLLVQLGVFAVAYLTAAPLSRAVKLEDVSRLETSTEGLGVLGKVIRPVFHYERILISSLNRGNSEPVAESIGGEGNDQT